MLQRFPGLYLDDGVVEHVLAAPDPREAGIAAAVAEARALLAVDGEELFDLWAHEVFPRERPAAPGDFAAVKRQMQMLGEAFEPEEFVEQLEREHAIKPDVKFSKPMGFVR